MTSRRPRTSSPRRAGDAPEGRPARRAGAGLRVAPAPRQRREPAAARPSPTTSTSCPDVRRVRRHRRLHHPQPHDDPARADRHGRAVRGGHGRADHRPSRPRRQDDRRRGAVRRRRPREAALLALELLDQHEADDDFPEVRIGMAYGNVLNHMGDVFGPVVNIASRLTSVARPGQRGHRPRDGRRAARRRRAARQADASDVGEGLRAPEPWSLKRPRDQTASD